MFQLQYSQSIIPRSLQNYEETIECVESPKASECRHPGAEADEKDNEVVETPGELVQNNTLKQLRTIGKGMNINIKGKKIEIAQRIFAYNVAKSKANAADD